jgi:uncharacterized membrane protein YeaQ/YmgE (transglycosylase-associated protein family)
MGDITGIIATLIVGAISGWLASQIMKKRGGLLYYIVIGIVGSFVGSFIFNLLGWAASGLVGSIAASVAGACVLLFVIGKLFKK